MGTNYYLIENKCECCGRAGEPLHIGKSSGGWYFNLHITEEIPNLETWTYVLKHTNDKSHIEDEYGASIPTMKLYTIMTDRYRESPISKSEEELKQNYATKGINNLLKPIGNHVIGYADKLPIAYITGEFS